MSIERRSIGVRDAPRPRLRRIGIRTAAAVFASCGAREGGNNQIKIGGCRVRVDRHGRPSSVRGWIGTGHTGMRRGMPRLVLTVQKSLKRDPRAGDLYIFRGQRGDWLQTATCRVRNNPACHLKARGCAVIGSMTHFLLYERLEMRFSQLAWCLLGIPP